MQMTDKSVKKFTYINGVYGRQGTAKRYHSPVRIGISFVSGLWLGWGFSLLEQLPRLS